jgi:hypothetical protein
MICLRLNFPEKQRAALTLHRKVIYSALDFGQSLRRTGCQPIKYSLFSPPFPFGLATLAMNPVLFSQVVATPAAT